MPLNDAALDVGGEAIAAVLDFAQFHNGDPGGAGTSNVIAGGRQAIVMISTDGDLSLSAPVTKTGLTPLEDVDFITFWSLGAAGTYYGSTPRTTGDAAVNADGEYTIDSISIPGSAT